jgi:ribose transport system ATP-binding protein
VKVPRIKLENLTVQFPGTRALDTVSLELEPGEVHGIIGENGAGKSTLMRVLAGLQPPTSGRVLLDGRAVSLRGPIDAAALGIAMIHQELNLVDELSVAENLSLGREPTRGPLLDRGRLRDIARRWLELVGFPDIDPRSRLGTLGIAQQQAVEIAKAVAQQAGVLIMDEPTAVLGESEASRLFDLVRRLRAEGRTIIYISHRLAEVRALCDRVSVLRDGRLVTTLQARDRLELTEARLASLMVGRDIDSLDELFPPLPEPKDEVAFECEGMTVPGVVGPIDLRARRGEIIGLAGLIGSGRTEWAQGVIGLRATRGTVNLAGEPFPHRSVRSAMTRGLVYLSEDRKEAGLHTSLSIAANTTLATLRRYCHPAPLGPIALMDRKAIESVATAHAKNLGTRMASVRSPITSLSGGNQQKVALAKWLDAKPRVLILDEPTRGVDVGAKQDIYRVIVKLADEGMACIVISSELPELLGLCHRVAVFKEGRLATVLDRDEADEQTVMRHAAQ